MAFQLLRKGFAPDYRPPERWAERPVIVETRVGAVEVARKEIAEMFSESVLTAISAWNDYKRFGLPFSGGWAEQPAVLLDAIRALDEEAEHGAQR